MRILLITLFALTLPGYVFSQTEHAEKLGLDLSNDSDVAVYMMMYQIGLKDRGQNLLGSHSCISLSRDNEGNTTLSFGMNTDAFATGTVDFNDDNNKKFLNTKNTLSSLFSFFDQANYKPQIGVRSYADPQNNIMSKYAQGGEVDQRYSSQLFGANSSTDGGLILIQNEETIFLLMIEARHLLEIIFQTTLKIKFQQHRIIHQT